MVKLIIGVVVGNLPTRSACIEPSLLDRGYRQVGSPLAHATDTCGHNQVVSDS